MTPEHVVAFTFAERAATEIKERMHPRAEGVLPAETLSRLGDMFVGTIHAYCAPPYVTERGHERFA